MSKHCSDPDILETIPQRYNIDDHYARLIGKPAQGVEHTRTTETDIASTNKSLAQDSPAAISASGFGSKWNQKEINNHLSSWPSPGSNCGLQNLVAEPDLYSNETPSLPKSKLIVGSTSVSNVSLPWTIVKTAESSQENGPLGKRETNLLDTCDSSEIPTLPINAFDMHSFAQVPSNPDDCSTTQYGWEPMQRSPSASSSCSSLELVCFESEHHHHSHKQSLPFASQDNLSIVLNSPTTHKAMNEEEEQAGRISQQDYHGLLNSEYINVDMLMTKLDIFTNANNQPHHTCSDKTARYEPIRSRDDLHKKYTFYSQKVGLVQVDRLADIVENTEHTKPSKHQRKQPSTQRPTNAPPDRDQLTKLAQILCTNVFWLDIWAPSFEEIRSISEIFYLHQLTFEYLEQEYNKIGSETYDDCAEAELAGCNRFSSDASSYNRSTHTTTTKSEQMILPEFREHCDMFAGYLSISVRAFIFAEDMLGLSLLDDKQRGKDEGGDGNAGNGHSGDGEKSKTQSSKLKSIDIHMLVFPGFVVTLHRDRFDCARTVSQRIRLLSARLGLTADWVVYALLEDIMDQLSPLVQKLEQEVDAIDELVLVLTNEQTDLLRRIARVRKELTELQRIYTVKGELLRTLIKRCSSNNNTCCTYSHNPTGISADPATIEAKDRALRYQHRSRWFGEDAQLYLRDLHDHLILVAENLSHYDETLGRSHTNYLAQISIEISHTSNRMSEVMKKLTAAASVVMPWSLVCGIFGMNICVPGYDSYANQSWIPFGSLVVFMIASSLIVFLLGKRRGWF